MVLPLAVLVVVVALAGMDKIKSEALIGILGLVLGHQMGRASKGPTG
jgi:hypothetical protein